MANNWQYGNAITLRGTFTDDLGAPADPPVVKVTVLKPNGVSTTYVYGTDVEVLKEDIGVYAIDVLGDIVGIWYYRWFSDTPDEVSKEVFFEILRVRTV